MTSSAILIPARLDSIRFPNKMLADINGKPLIKHVYDICGQTGLDTYVVTDSKKIASIIPNTILTDQASNGTERCALAIKDLDHKQFVNVQGDMIDIRPDMIDKTIWHLKNYSLATLFCELKDNELSDVNVVKVIRAGDKALWFSRFNQHYGYRHLGIYGYKRNALEMYHTLQVPQEEQIEKLEQLRWLKGGWDMGCLKTEFAGMEINTPEDLKSWQTWMTRQQPL